MSGLLLCAILLATGSAPPTAPSIEASSLRRQDLPNDFPFQVLDEGFAVLRLEIRNDTRQSWVLKVEDIEVFDKRGKSIQRALPTDITPKLMKYYQGTYRDVHAEARYGTPGVVAHPQMGRIASPRIDRSSKRPTVAVGTASKLRAKLEEYEVRDVELGPGEKLEALYYLKSRKSGNKLSGGHITVAGRKASF